jgi:hypothetical protein
MTKLQTYVIVFDGDDPDFYTRIRIGARSVEDAEARFLRSRYRKFRIVSITRLNARVRVPHRR